MSTTRGILISLAALWLLGGGLATTPLAFSSPPAPDAWLEAKPACVFPLSTDAPLNTSDVFFAALTGGLQKLAVTPAPAALVQIQADVYPSFSSLRIDLSNCVENDSHKPPKVNWHYAPTSAIHVKRLEVIANPLLIGAAKIQYNLTAADAELNMAEDRANHPLLMLMGTSAGHVSVIAGHGDVESLCLAAGKVFAHKYGFSMSGLSLAFSSSDVHTLDVHLTVTLGGAMGGKLFFTGRFQIAANFNATATNLSCHGEGPGGVVVSGLLSPGLMFYNGKTKPLVAFPFNAMRLHDVSFHADNNLRIEADFGK